MDNTPAFKNPLNNYLVARTHPQNVTVNALGLLALPLPCWNLLLPLGHWKSLMKGIDKKFLD